MLSKKLTFCSKTHQYALKTKQMNFQKAYVGVHMSFLSPIDPSLMVSPSDTPPSEQDKIQAICDKHFVDVPKDTPVGCNVVIMREGKPYYELHGGGIPPNAAQHWGSVSKQFTAACIVKLVNMGLLKYDDDIRMLCPDLPEFKYKGEAQKITVDDLLHMCSGLPDVWNIALIAGQDPELLTNDELLSLLLKHSEMIHFAQTEFTYCNTNYFILAKIIETVGKPLLKADQNFVDFVREQIFENYGMHETRCSSDRTRVLAQAEISGFGPDYHQSTKQIQAYGATGVIGPASDMVHWNEALAQGEMRDLLEMPPKSVAPRHRTYCRGLGIDQIGDYQRISHAGELTGYVTEFRRYEHRDDPKKTFALFLTTNYEDKDLVKAKKIADEIADVLAEKTLTQDEPQESQKIEQYIPSTMQEKAAKHLEGTYRCEELGVDWIVQAIEEKEGHWGIHLRVTPADRCDSRALSESLPFSPKIENDTLVFQLPGVFQIEPLSDDMFLCRGEKMAPTHFRRIS